MTSTINGDSWSLPDFRDDVSLRNQWDRSPLWGDQNPTDEQVELERFEYLAEQCGSC